MTNAGQPNLDARIIEAENRLAAGGPSALWTSLVNDLCFAPQEQPRVMSRLWHVLPAEQRVPAISMAWALTNPPGQLLPREEWLEKFWEVGYIDDAHLYDGHKVTPPDQVTLWRGGITANGLSWSADRDRAERFQTMYGPDKPPGKLWTVSVRAEHLLAHFNVLRPGEDEYVVDPAGLEPTEIS